MPWRLVSIIGLFVIVLSFIGFNLGNTSSISFFFYTKENIPVFFPLLIAFVAGMLFSFPFFLKKKKKEGHGSRSQDVHQNASLDDASFPNNDASLNDASSSVEDVAGSIKKSKKRK